MELVDGVDVEHTNDTVEDNTEVVEIVHIDDVMSTDFDFLHTEILQAHTDSESGNDVVC